MQEFLYILGIIFVFFLGGFVLLNIKQIVSGKEFSGTCASANPALKGKMGTCPGCNGKSDGSCKNKDGAPDIDYEVIGSN